MNDPLVVVGGGIAGLSVALAAAPHPVLLLARSMATDASASGMAQGGLAAAVGADDQIELHIADTMNAGADHNDAVAVDLLCRQAPAAVHWLRANGVQFDRDGEHLHLAREGGHGRARILQSGGDTSGRNILLALREAVRNAAHVQVRLDSEVDGLLCSGPSVAGVRLRAGAAGTRDVTARAVVLATGGIGGLFAATTNPPGADGNGIALAQALGARLRDLEFLQFHPTALALPQRQCLPLLTEALRGAGARLIDEHGYALMQGKHPLADLAPRDVIARVVFNALQQGRGAWLDLSPLNASARARFPNLQRCLDEHFPAAAVERLPVVPAMHFHMGGIAVDLDGRSSIPGLYAVGEVACNGVHGGNRLASNSLLEGVVFGRRIGSRFAGAVGAAAARVGQARVVARAAPMPVGLRPALQQRLAAALGPVRNGACLRESAAWIEEQPGLAASWQGGVARALLQAALDRQGSLGGHYRSDTSGPQTTTADALA